MEVKILKRRDGCDQTMHEWHVFLFYFLHVVGLKHSRSMVNFARTRHSLGSINTLTLEVEK